MQRIGEQPLPDSFSRRLETTFSRHGQLCVGIDPHDQLLEDSGFATNPQGLADFCNSMLDALSGTVGIIKPQVSFFERYGSLGFKVLEDLCSQASSRGFLVIADAKRGDIGTTMSAYADAWLAKDAPFIVDALTVSPYLGVGALAPAVALASERGKGLFVLCATSNSEGRELQSAIGKQGSVASMVVQEVQVLNGVSAQSKTRFGTVGLVVGATVKLDALGLSDLNLAEGAPKSAILAPGFGAQGAKLSDAKHIFGANADNVIYTISRSALRDGIASVSAVVKADQLELAEALSE